MVRATTGGVLKSYRSNLMNSFIASNKARDTVLSQRNFNSYAEDPAAAAKAFRLRMSRLTVNSQYSICENAYHKFQAGFSCLLSVDEMIDTENGGNHLTTLKSTTFEMLNDPTGDARTQLAKILDELDDAIIQSMNQTYGDNFIFAGADGSNVPFTVNNLSDGTKQLCYRGIPVDTHVPELKMDGGNVVRLGNGNYVLDSAELVPANAADPDYATLDKVTLSDGIEYYVLKDSKGRDASISPSDYEQAKVDADKLDYLMNEKRFVDIGLGFKEEIDPVTGESKLIEASAFNESLNGLTFLGYGVDTDGDPKNIYSIVQRLKEISQRVPDGTDWDRATYDEFFDMVGKLEDASSNFKSEFANMDAGTKKLSFNLDLLEDNFYNLDEQTANIEDVDMADAITSFIWAEYCYNAALKVGNNILSQSLMDYLN